MKTDLKVFAFLASLPFLGVGAYLWFGESLPVWFIVAVIFMWLVFLESVAREFRQDEESRDGREKTNESSEMGGGGGCHLGVRVSGHGVGEAGTEHSVADVEANASDEKP